MKTATLTEVRDTRIERGLPFAGPAVALVTILFVALATPVSMMVG